MKHFTSLLATATAVLGQAAQKANDTYTFEFSWKRGNETCLAGEGRF